MKKSLLLILLMSAAVLRAQTTNVTINIPSNRLLSPAEYNYLSALLYEHDAQQAARQAQIDASTARFNATMESYRRQIDALIYAK
jgi:hypothetical protein